MKSKSIFKMVVLGSALLMVMGLNLASASAEKVLYVSGEESLEQIKMRGERLGVSDGDLYLLAETNLERIIFIRNPILSPCKSPTKHKMPCKRQADKYISLNISLDAVV